MFGGTLELRGRGTADRKELKIRISKALLEFSLG
jgi:hypothetical protein